MTEGGELFAWLIGIVVIGLAFKGFIKGIVKLFQKYNPILAILYMIILFPIAICHILLLGLFRDSEQIMLDKAKEQAKFEKLVEKEKNNL